MTISVIKVCLIGLFFNCFQAKNSVEKYAQDFLKDYEPLSIDQYTKDTTAQWNYDSNMTSENKNIMIDVSNETAQFDLMRQKEFAKFTWKSFKNESLKRQFKPQSLKGMAALPSKDYLQLLQIETNMSSTYSEGKVLSMDGKHKLRLDPGLTKIMATSQDYKKLSYVWEAWRNTVGKPIRQKYIKYMKLLNYAAKLNDFTDFSQYLIEDYESKTFMSDIEKLWTDIKPLYEQLHAFVRSKLIKKYGSGNIKDKGTIPAHILGNMWAQSWANIFKLVTPYPKKQVVNVTDALITKGYNAKKMFKKSEEFFTSLGLKPMTTEFWKNSIITRPTDRELACHGSAWDFGDKKDFRIKMCTVVNMEDFYTIHHEMGHVQYFMQYANQPLVFRNGANPGFHEAIGDTMALSVMTPEHLHKIGLLETVDRDDEADLNFLMNMALSKIAFLPFGYLIDKYRWELFSGKTPVKDLNRRWWELREMYQGVSPPVERTENDFDAGAKYHIPNGVPYVRYFVAAILQFQFQEALCNISGYKGPLHRCDISATQYKAMKVGSTFAKFLQMGSSRPWPETLKTLTGTSKMNASSLLNYFKPLHDWLKKQNKNNKVGWIVPSKTNALKPDKPTVKSTVKPTTKKAASHRNSPQGASQNTAVKTCLLVISSAIILLSS